MMMKHRLTDKAIDPGSVMSSVRGPKLGGTVVFIGTVRDNSEAGHVDGIRYEAYTPMAEKKLEQIENDVGVRWPGAKVSLVHRIGELHVGEVSVAVVVSAPHRGDAFEACRLAIERIKHEVPIWKKERLSDGSERWVEGRQESARRSRPRSRQRPA